MTVIQLAGEIPLFYANNMNCDNSVELQQQTVVYMKLQNKIGPQDGNSVPFCFVVFIALLGLDPEVGRPKNSEGNNPDFYVLSLEFLPKYPSSCLF